MQCDTLDGFLGQAKDISWKIGGIYIVWSLIPRNVPINVGFSVLTSWQWKMLMLEETAWGAHKISPCYFYHLSVNPGIIANQKVYKPTEDKLKTQSSMSSKTDDQVGSLPCVWFQEAYLPSCIFLSLLLGWNMSCAWSLLFRRTIFSCNITIIFFSVAQKSCRQTPSVFSLPPQTVAGIPLQVVKGKCTYFFLSYKFQFCSLLKQKFESLDVYF